MVYFIDNMSLLALAVKTIITYLILIAFFKYNTIYKNK
jgi:hypothetical protein